MAATVVPALDDCDSLTQELLAWTLHLLLMNLLECNVVRCSFYAVKLWCNLAPGFPLLEF